jgi:uncharacterized protein YkwD
VSLTRGRVTESRELSPPTRAEFSAAAEPTVSLVTSASAAAPARVALAALVAASFIAFLVAGRADGAGRSWASYVAPVSACPGSTDASAAPPVQERAVGCLLNWARAEARLKRLGRPALLGRAATLKGRKVAACGNFSHTPCGSDPRAALRAVGYRYSTMGENLFLGAWGGVSPREAVAAWLRSPAHRANILRPGFRHVGAALVRAPGMRTDGDGALWITEFATPR